MTARRPPADGARILSDLHAILTRYVILPSAEAAVAVVLWIAATHAQPAWEHATRLVVTSPVKQCGKSRLLDIIEATCHKPLMTVNISAAALARSVGPDDPPTLILDEADAVFGKSSKGDEKAETLRGLLNAGHQRNRPYIRWDPSRRERGHCPSFAMAAIAAIGGLPDTITDRAVVIHMRRRAPGEHVAPFRFRRDTPPLRRLGSQLHDWARGSRVLAALRDAEPDLPVDDRPADNWTPLVALADLAGGDWPGRARKACEVRTAGAAEDDVAGSLPLRLLHDLALIFGDAQCLYTTTILARLYHLDESPWRDYYGRPFSARDLAERLRSHEVLSRDVRESGGPNRKGYRRDDLVPAWSRYLSAWGIRDKGDMGDIAGQGLFPVADVAASRDKGDSHIALTSTVADVADVADDPPGTDPWWPGQDPWEMP
jgi:Protein of unknown function (DUF3631)